MAFFYKLTFIIVQLNRIWICRFKLYCHYFASVHRHNGLWIKRTASKSVLRLFSCSWLNLMLVKIVVFTSAGCAFMIWLISFCPRVWWVIQGSRRSHKTVVTLRTQSDPTKLILFTSVFRLFIKRSITEETKCQNIWSDTHMNSTMVIQSRSK